MIDILWQRLCVNLCMVTCVLGAILSFGYDTENDPAAVRMQSGNTVLYDHRDECWVGAAPKDAPAVPGHVVMRIEGSAHESWFYGGPRYVDIALADVFTKDNPRVFVVAFCY